MTTGAISNWLENKILNHVLRNSTLTSSSAVYIALYTTDPTDADTGTEVTGTGYYRKGIERGFSSPSDGETSNIAQIDFPQAGGSWGTITHVGIRNAFTSGSLLFYCSLDSPVTVNNTGYFSIPARALSINLNASTGVAGESAYGYYLSNKLLDYILNYGTFATPGLSVYAGLYTTVPTPGDLYGVEVAIGSSKYDYYVRKRISGTSDWSIPTSGSTGNTTSKVFTTGAPEDWGTIEGICFRDASTGGNLLFTGYFDSSVPMFRGDGLYFDIADIKVSAS